MTARWQSNKTTAKAVNVYKTKKRLKYQKHIKYPNITSFFNFIKIKEPQQLSYY